MPHFWAGRPERGSPSWAQNPPHTCLPPGEVGPGCRPPGAAPGLPRLHQRHAAPTASWCLSIPAAAKLPWEGGRSRQPLRGSTTSTQVSRQSGSASRSKTTRRPTIHSPTPTLLREKPQESICPLQRPGLGVDTDHPRLLPGPWGGGHVLTNRTAPKTQGGPRAHSPPHAQSPEPTKTQEPQSSPTSI